MNLWFLSFCDGSQPAGQQFLGAAIVPASNIIEATRVSHAVGVNPGGEVSGHPIVYQGDYKPIPKEYIERLLSKEQIDAFMKEIGAPPG